MTVPVDRALNLSLSLSLLEVTVPVDRALNLSLSLSRLEVTVPVDRALNLSLDRFGDLAIRPAPLSLALR